MKTKTHLRFTEDRMLTAVQYAEQGNLYDCLRTVWLAYGLDLEGDGPGWKCTDYSMPVDQWKEIANALTRGTDKANEGVHPMARVNLMLDFMNVSPSAVEEGGQ